MILKTDRLILRPQAMADAPDLFAILSDPETMRFWSRPVITRLAVVEELMCEQQAAMDQGLCRYWTLHSNGRAIGSVDLSLIQEASAELGFILRSDRWGAGLASEAVGAVIAHAFDALRLSRLAAVAQSANRAAVRVLEKNRFALIETRPVMIADGQRKDCAFYLLRRESL
jgi:[ribosomal protein S5]-alanine N-acetyltransferase